ncbi:MAG: endolytic transglycosylase MltG [Bacillota bacterium]|nr:endolytic transglycosylase MltG [Bacillota bacterium]
MDPARQALAGLGQKEREALLFLRRHPAALYLLARGLAALLGLAALVLVALGPASPPPQPDRLVYLPPGSTTREATMVLAREGLLRHPALFRLLARVRGLDRSLRAGEYRLNAGMPSWTVLAALAEGRTVTRRVTLPEGLQAREVVYRLARAGAGTEEELWELVSSPEKVFGDRLPTELAGAASLEGFLFPDTYELSRGEPPERLLRRMVERFLAEARPLYEQSPLRQQVTFYQMVVLASLVEAEAQVEEERRTIAGVFYNRLSRGMPLQSCATVEYALGRHKSRLSLDDLQVDSPYNTYLHPGLPPGPIGNPGRSSLAAVAQPESTPYLYFVAKGDGTHRFSCSYGEHLLAQRRYEAGLRRMASPSR